MRRVLSLFAGLATAATLASAAHAGQPSPIQRIIVQEDYKGVAQRALRHAAPVVVTIRDGGFDWTDAGIGAAGAVALGLLGAGGVLLVRDGREQKAHG
jgi:hypothetical protein